MLTSVGISETCKLLGDLPGGLEFAYIAYGTGTKSEASGDTTLESEVDRGLATVGLESTLAPRDTVVWCKCFVVEDDVNIAEVGVFNASSGGDMLGRKKLASTVFVGKGSIAYVKFKAMISDGGYSGGST